MELLSLKVISNMLIFNLSLSTVNSYIKTIYLINLGSMSHNQFLFLNCKFIQYALFFCDFSIYHCQHFCVFGMVFQNDSIMLSSVVKTASK